MNNNLEEAANNILPVFANIFSVIGITLFIASLIIGIYKLAKKENGKTIIMYGSVGGIIIWMGSLLVNIMSNIDPISTLKTDIFISAIIALLVFGIFSLLRNQSADDDISAGAKTEEDPSMDSSPLLTPAEHDTDSLSASTKALLQKAEEESNRRTD